MKQKSYCVVCGKEKNGLEVKTDNVIKTIRYIKLKLFHKVRNNRLVVCKECYDNYKKFRKRYVSRQRMYVGLGVLFLIFGMLLNPSVGALLAGLVIIAVLYLLSLLNYLPEIDPAKLPRKKK